MKKWKLIYGILFLGICLCPSLGMLVTKQVESSENRELAAFPVLRGEDGINVEWLSEAGDYFQDHFAFRNELVTVNALLYGKLLGVSTAQGVIQGKNGWLYYKDSLSDYLGTDLLSERSLFNLAHTLSLVQQNLQSRGIKFLFTVAPNKNSLYGENMPYYYSLKVTKNNNLARLVPVLEQERVAYADLYEVFQAEDEILYHQRDSHWNNKGAALAGEVLLTALGKEHASYQEETYEIRSDFEGDLDNMLYPLAVTPEDEIYYDKQTTYAVVGEIENNFEPRIVTVNPVKGGSLVMYRDSFGNALLPFMADAYGNAYFSRGVPYQLSDVDTMSADTVVVERAERFLPEMVQDPPVMEGTAVQWDGEIENSAGDGASDVLKKQWGALVQISGRILPDFLDTDTSIYLRLNGAALYEAFPVDVETENGTDAGGFCLYLPPERFAPKENTLEVLVSEGEILKVIYKNTFKEVTDQ
ncbi:MAG: hypothetical protein Q4C91_20430 [Eubacteriales bacterium]|nr:hypothetical protein [Eubacteriales bacterium]